MSGKRARVLRRRALRETGLQPRSKDWPQYVEKVASTAHAGITRRHYLALKRAYREAL